MINKKVEEQVRELLGQAIGEASVCWDKDGVFESTRASLIVDRLATALDYAPQLPSREEIDMWLMRQDYMDPDAAEMYVGEFYEYLIKHLERK